MYLLYLRFNAFKPERIVGRNIQCATIENLASNSFGCGIIEHFSLVGF